jgi:hypothetical protein
MKIRLFTIVIIPLFLSGCIWPSTFSHPTATPLPNPTATVTPAPLVLEGMITFKRYDEREFYGQVYGHGPTAIILANMAYGGQEQWAPLVTAFDRDRFTLVTFNYFQILQGDYASAEQEAQVILETLKGFGFKRTICIGASMGTSACGVIAHDTSMVGIVLIAGQNFGGTLDVVYPKLFIAGKLDPNSSFTATDYKRADDPKSLILYPDVAVHGTSMFGASVGDQFLKDLLDFIDKNG